MKHAQIYKPNIANVKESYQIISKQDRFGSFILTYKCITCWNSVGTIFRYVEHKVLVPVAEKVKSN